MSVPALAEVRGLAALHPGVVVVVGAAVLTTSRRRRRRRRRLDGRLHLLGFGLHDDHARRWRHPPDSLQPLLYSGASGNGIVLLGLPLWFLFNQFFFVFFVACCCLGN